MAAHSALIVFLCLAGALLTAGAVVKSDQGCPEDWTKFGTRCFKFFNAKATWTNAEKSCHSHGANLASFHSKEEHDFIVHLIKKTIGSDTRSWIGGYDAVQEGQWMWTDGSLWDYTNWNPGQPDNHSHKEHCLEIRFTRWNDRPVSIIQNYVCSKDAPLKPKPPVKSVFIIMEGFRYKCTPDTE